MKALKLPTLTAALLSTGVMATNDDSGTVNIFHEQPLTCSLTITDGSNGGTPLIPVDTASLGDLDPSVAEQLTKIQYSTNGSSFTFTGGQGANAWEVGVGLDDVPTVTFNNEFGVVGEIDSTLGEPAMVIFDTVTNESVSMATSWEKGRDYAVALTFENVTKENFDTIVAAGTYTGSITVDMACGAVVPPTK